jgi:hypothetical protein
MHGGGAADSHGRGGVGSGEIPGDDQQGYLVGVSALERTPDGIEFIAQLFDGFPNALLGFFADTLGGPIIVEDIGDGRLGHVSGARDVFDGRPNRKRRIHAFTIAKRVLL